MTIRQAKESDLGGAYEVERQAYEGKEAASKARFEKRIREFPEGFLVAEIKGRIVGVMNSATLDKEDISDEELKDMIGHVPGGRNIVIFTLAVLPEFQGQGIAGKLMNRFMKLSQEMGKKKIMLLCREKLVAFYQKFGFKDLGKSRSTHADIEWHEMNAVLFRH